MPRTRRFAIVDSGSMAAQRKARRAPRTRAHVRAFPPGPQGSWHHCKRQVWAGRAGRRSAARSATQRLPALHADKGAHTRRRSGRRNALRFSARRLLV